MAEWSMAVVLKTTTSTPVRPTRIERGFL